ncbi:unnamed protein product [Somion occarium]|uniref:Cytochrome P450 n=1 Tax=Somion occarium TaxID=3059160 RepID=A0ABP1CW38_9APHY
MGSLRIMAAIDAIHDISHSKAFFLLGLCAVVIFVVRWYKASLKGTLPPGPRGFPIVGNTFQLGRLPWFQLTRWARQYGPIYSLNLGGQILIVLNNHKVASDLLDKRSAIYADRPRMIMTGELLCGGFFFAFNSCNDLWRRLRKAAFEGLNFRSSEVFQPVQEREAIRLAEALVKNPSAWMDHINRVTASGVLSVCYSLPPVASAEDPVITLINNFMHRIEAGSRPGEYLVELFPWMLRLPKWMAKWHRDADEAHARDTEMFMKFHLDAKRRAALGQCGPCMSGILMERNEVSDKEAAWLAGTLFGAGSTTTAAAQHVFILAMVLYPAAMRKAQAEIDAVVGRSRLPNFSDRNKLPYVQAIIREVFRWRNIGPLGLPHYSTEDDWYEGYYIPKGSMIFFNQWAMNTDTEVYGDDFNTFRPERFLDETGKKENVPPNTHGEALDMVVGSALVSILPRAPCLSTSQRPCGPLTLEEERTATETYLLRTQMLSKIEDWLLVPIPSLLLSPLGTLTLCQRSSLMLNRSSDRSKFNTHPLPPKICLLTLRRTKHPQLYCNIYTRRKSSSLVCVTRFSLSDCFPHAFRYCIL